MGAGASELRRRPRTYAMRVTMRHHTTVRTMVQMGPQITVPQIRSSATKGNSERPAIQPSSSIQAGTGRQRAIPVSDDCLVAELMRMTRLGKT